MDEDFQIATRAFDLMTLTEKRLVLSEFALLRYSSVEDRFFEAVHRVVTEKNGRARRTSLAGR